MSKRALDILDDPILPVVDVNEILGHMEALAGPRVVDQMKIFLGRQEALNRSSVIAWLLEYEPQLYATIEGIVRSFQSSYLLAHETRETIFFLNHGLVVARDENHKLQQRIVLLEAQLAMRGEALVEEKSGEDQQPAKKKKPGRKKKVESPSTPPDETTKAHEAFVAEAASKMPRSKEPEKAESHFSRVEPWSDMFHVEDWVHYQRKGSQRIQLETLKDYSEWKSLFHVSGPWAAEQLQEILEDEGFLAVAIKRRRGTADQEPFNYKVVSTKPI